MERGGRRLRESKPPRAGTGKNHKEGKRKINKNGKINGKAFSQEGAEIRSPKGK